MHHKSMIFAAALCAVATACSASGGGQAIPAGMNPAGNSLLAQRGKPRVDTTSVLKLLSKQVVIGSTVDPSNKDVNPYGLAYVSLAPLTKGKVAQGDLVPCNFNNKANVQGQGTTVEVLKAKAGSKPSRLAQSKSLLGCSSTVLSEYDETWTTNALAKTVMDISPSGKIIKTLTNAAFPEPWSDTYAIAPFPYIPDAVFVADAKLGTIVRIDLNNQVKTYPVTTVITGLPVNHGAPGSILGPSGLTYDVNTDTLYVVDGVNNTVYAFDKAFNDLTKAKSIVVGKDGKSFSGAKSKDASVLFSGNPLNGPISAAELPNGNLIVGNTLDPSGTNLLVEIASNGKLLGTKNVDKGAAGALFGIATNRNAAPQGSQPSDASTVIYFNDDNANNVQALQK